MERRIIANIIQCNKCGDVIQSLHRHDFKRCFCTAVAVDGGNFYLRRTGKDYEDLSVNSDDDINTIRNFMYWGKNYDADMARLPETQWILLKDIDDAHLDAIIGYLNDRGDELKEIFKREKAYRNGRQL